MTTTARPARPAKPASEKAAGYWRSLRNDQRTAEIAILRALGHTDTADVLEADREDWTNTDGLTAAKASRDIDDMRAALPGLRRRVASILAEAAAATAAEAVAEAVAAGQDPAAVVLVADRLYEVDGVAYRTVQSKNGGGMYAKVLTAGRWEYAPGDIKKIRPEHRMSIDRAVALSIQIGRCVRCAAELTAPESVGRGLGPVCIKKI